MTLFQLAEEAKNQYRLSRTKLLSGTEINKVLTLISHLSSRFSRQRSATWLWPLICSLSKARFHAFPMLLDGRMNGRPRPIANHEPARKSREPLRFQRSEEGIDALSNLSLRAIHTISESDYGGSDLVGI